MMNRITSTQYLKKGEKTNVGIIKQLHEYKGITTIDGFYWNLNDTEVFKVQKAKVSSVSKGIAKPPTR